MAAVYARLILQGQKSLNDVPEELKEKVLEILKENGYPVD